MNKSPTLMRLAAYSHLKDKVIDYVQTDYIEVESKVDGHYNVCLPDKPCICHKDAQITWVYIDCTIYNNSLLALNHAERMCPIVIVGKIEELLYKQVALPNYLHLHAGNSAEGLKERNSIAWVTVNNCLLFYSGISHTVCLPQASFVSYFLYWINDTMCFHIFASEFIDSENCKLKSNFTFARLHLSDARETTLVQFQSPGRNGSYRTCKFPSNCYSKVLNRLTRCSPPDSEEAKHIWDNDIYTLVCALCVLHKWRNGDNHAIVCGASILTKQSQAHGLFQTRRKKIRRSDVAIGDTFLENIIVGHAIMVWLFGYLHVAAESNRNDYRDNWLTTATCNSNGKYEVIAETNDPINITEKDTSRETNPGVYIDEELVDINPINYEDGELGESTNCCKYKEDEFGESANHSIYKEQDLEETIICGKYAEDAFGGALSRSLYEENEFRQSTNPIRCKEDELRESTNRNQFIAGDLGETTNHRKYTNEEIAETTNRNNCNNEDKNPERRKCGWRRVNSRLSRELPDMESAKCDMVSTPIVLRASDRVYQLNSAPQTDQQSPDVPFHPQTTYVANQQRSSFLEAAQSENATTSINSSQISSVNQLSDFMFNAGVTETDIDELLSSDAELESLILNSEFLMDLCSDWTLDDGLIPLAFEDTTAANTGEEQVGVHLASDDSISDRLVASDINYKPPQLTSLHNNKHLSLNAIPRNASDSQSYPCSTCPPKSDIVLTTRLENNHASSDCCQAFERSNSIALTEILSNLTNRYMLDPCLIQCYPQHMVLPQTDNSLGEPSQQSNRHTEHMIVEEFLNENFDFQKNTLDVSSQTTEMEVCTEGKEETVLRNYSCHGSNNSDQDRCQTEASGTKKAQSLEPLCVDNTATTTHLQPCVILSRESRVFIQNITKRKCPIDRVSVGHPCSRSKKSRLELPGTHPACSTSKVNTKAGRPREKTVRYNLRCRLPTRRDK